MLLVAIQLFASPYEGHVRSGAIRNEAGTILPRRDGFTRRDLDYLTSIYDGAIREFDHLIGTFLRQLKTLEIGEPIIVFTSDHGEQLMERGLWGHNRTSQVEELHVPLIIRVPGVAPTVVRHPVTLLDLFPTLVELVGQLPPEGIVEGA